MVSRYRDNRLEIVALQTLGAFLGGLGLFYMRGSTILECMVLVDSSVKVLRDPENPIPTRCFGFLSNLAIFKAPTKMLSFRYGKEP